MAVTTLTQARARPGEGVAMLRDWLTMLTRYSPSLRQRRFALVFQAIDDPRRLLYLAEWATRAAFDARAEEIGSRRWVRAHAETVSVTFLELGHTVERALAPVEVAQFGRLHVPSATREAVSAYLRDERTIGSSAPHFAVRTVYADPDAPDDLLVYRGWSAPAGLAAYHDERWPAIVAELERHGVTGEYFLGYTRAALYRSPEESAQIPL